MTHIRMVLGEIHGKVLKIHVMKEELSRKEVTREIWNGLYVCLKYRVELGIKVWKNVRKTHILSTFR